MLIVGQNDWQNKGPTHGPQPRKPRAHALAHKHQQSINSGNLISQNQCSTRLHRISSHPISFHSTLHQSQHKGRSNGNCGLSHWHTYVHRNALKPYHKTNVTPDRASNAFPMLNVRSLQNKGSNHKHAHVAISSSRCGTLTRLSNDV